MTEEVYDHEGRGLQIVKIAKQTTLSGLLEWKRENNGFTTRMGHQDVYLKRENIILGTTLLENRPNLIFRCPGPTDVVSWNTFVPEVEELMNFLEVSAIKAGGSKVPVVKLRTIKRVKGVGKPTPEIISENR